MKKSNENNQNQPKSSVVLMIAAIITKSKNEFKKFLELFCGKGIPLREALFAQHLDDEHGQMHLLFITNNEMVVDAMINEWNRRIAPLWEDNYFPYQIVEWNTKRLKCIKLQKKKDGTTFWVGIEMLEHLLANAEDIAAKPVVPSNAFAMTPEDPVQVEQPVDEEDIM